MQLITWTLLLGPALIVGVKVISWLFAHLKIRRKLREVPQFPSHWLMGNTDMLKDASSYFKIVKDMVVSKRIRMECFWFGPFPVIGVTHPETVQQLMKQNNSKGRGMTSGAHFIREYIGESLVLTNGKIWERKRKLLTPAFHLDVLKEYIPKMNKCADVFVGKLAKASKEGPESVEIMSHLKRATLETILKCSLSCDDDIQHAEREHPYLAAVQNICRILWYRMMHPMLFHPFIFKWSKVGKEWAGHLKIAHQFSGRLITERQQELADESCSLKRKPDFLDIVLQTRTSDGQGLELQEIHDEVTLFTFAGHDTTMSSLTWALYALSKHPEYQKLVYEEIQNMLEDNEDIKIEDIGKLEYLGCFVREVLRFYSPVPVVTREIDEPTAIDGVDIPIGTRVDVMIDAVHHNPDVWNNPEEFRPDRFNKENRTKQHPFAFIPFSAGKRTCIGQVFAMHEIKIFLVKLVQRFEIIMDKNHVPIPVPCVVMVSENGVKIKWNHGDNGDHEETILFHQMKEFRPDRFNKENRTKQHPFAFIPFSAGKRTCIGQVFAMHEIKIFLVKLVQRFEIIMDKNHVPIPVPCVVMVSENGVKIKVRERSTKQSKQ